MPVHHERGSTLVTCSEVASFTFFGLKGLSDADAAIAIRQNESIDIIDFFILFCNDFITPRSLELYLYCDLVVRKGTGEYESAVIS